MELSSWLAFAWSTLLMAAFAQGAQSPQTWPETTATQSLATLQLRSYRVMSMVCEALPLEQEQASRPVKSATKQGGKNRIIRAG
jgi:hypothetical protein